MREAPRFTQQRSPSVRDAERIMLPADSRSADEIIQALIEGRADECQQDAREAA